MLKAEATLIPNRVRQLFSNVEGFRQVAPLGDFVKLADPETGAPQHLLCCVARAKNTGTIIVISNVVPPHHRDMEIPPDHESSVHVSFFNHPSEQAGRVEAFLDVLQECFIYSNEDDIPVHKESMLNHILNNECAYIYL